MTHAEPFTMILLSCLLFLLPSLLCGPSYKGGNLDVNIDQGMIDDIFGSNLDSARYGNTDEEWVDVPITLLPEEGDDCGPMQQPRHEPQMMEMAEELQQIAVIKADPAEGKKCDFYTKTEGFECVPYYQCDEGTIITDGFGLIDIRFGGSDSGQPELAVLDSTDLMCPGSLDVCCKDPDFVKVKEELNNPYGGGENFDEEEVVDEGKNAGYGEEQDSSEEDDNPYNQEVVVEAESSEETEDLVDPEDPYSNSELEELEATTPEPEPDTYNVVPEKLVFQPQCGRRNQLGLGVRIQNYKDGEAQFGEWPHMCAVLKRDITTVEVEAEGGYGGTELKEEEILVFVAGASLIAPGVVMTGAHKVNDYKDSFEQLVVRCGEWDTQTESEPLKHQDRNVSSGAIHQEFNPRNLYNTIALLFLETDFTLSSHVDTICLPSYKENFDDRTECYVKGWGKDHFGPDASYQVVMKEVKVPMVDHATCQDQLRATPRLPRQFRLHDSFNCAGGEAGQDACRGDGGGPLVCLDEDTERYTQAGIVAWGIGCGEENVPGVYTDVAAQVCWIDWTLACRNFNHVLFNGPECNAWYEEKKKHRVKPLRNIYESCGITWGDGRNAEIVEAGEGGYGK